MPNKKKSKKSPLREPSLKKKLREENSGKEKKEKEEICEIFEIEKDGKEKTIEKCNTLEVKNEEKIDKKTFLNENKILLLAMIIMIVVILSFLVVFSIMQSSKKFEYKGIKFDVIKEVDVTFYHTVFPVYEKGLHTKDYNVYLRKDPRIIGKNVDFSGKAFPSNYIVINISNSNDSFNCNGDGIIAIANFQQIMTAFGSKIVNDPNASCDKDNRYLFISIKPGEKTKIEQTTKSCYTFYINNCEILDVSERYLIDVLEQDNKL